MVSTLNGVPYAIIFANIGYDGSGGHVLASDLITIIVIPCVLSSFPCC